MRRGRPGRRPQETGRSEPGDQTHHLWRLIAIWVVLSVVLDPLFYFLVGPHVPPGTMTDTASGAQFDFNVLFIIALPVMLAVWVYMAYALIMWRASRGGSRAGGRRRGPWPPRDPGRAGSSSPP